MNAPRYKNAHMQSNFELLLALAADETSEMYYEGRPRRGAGHRAAFWDGFTGDFTFSGPGRSAMVVPGTLSAAYFMAGREFAKRLKKSAPEKFDALRRDAIELREHVYRARNVRSTHTKEPKHGTEPE